jgi:cyclic pyranopterin phosphate synthase
MMVDVGAKNDTVRKALAEAWVELPESVFVAVRDGDMTKGNPISIAELGGIMGAKKTPDLIPLCHGIRLDSLKVSCELHDEKKSLRILCEASARDVTGVEMEALTGVSVAALVFYDMCKGVDKGMIIRSVRLLEKSGGKSGEWAWEEKNG